MFRTGVLCTVYGAQVYLQIKESSKLKVIYKNCVMNLE